MAAELTIAIPNPRLAELQESLLDSREAAAKPVLEQRSDRLQIIHPGGRTDGVQGSQMAGSVGRLSRFLTSASDALSRKTHMISLIANTALLIGKSYVYWKSQSMAILASLIDSAVDMVAQGVLMIANRIVTDRRDEQNVRYPAGRSKLESIGVVACALVMAMAAAQVIQSSVNELLGTERLLEVGVLDILIMGATTVIKLGLWIWCKAVHFKTGNVTVRAAGR